MIYLDYAANTMASSTALDAFVNAESKCIGNANSSHKLGEQTRQMISDATRDIASSLGVDPTGIIYTSSATEANNMAIKGIAYANAHKGKHIIVTSLGHSSVLEPARFLAKNGFDVDEIDVSDLNLLREKLRDDTILVVASKVDSVSGEVIDTASISKLVRENSSIFHVDYTQAVCKLYIDYDEADTFALSAHKFYGVGGVGIFYKKKHVDIEPLIHGGESTTRYRSGTPAVGLVCSLAAALIEGLEKQDERYEYVRGLNAYLRDKLIKIDRIVINSTSDATPYILNLSANDILGVRMQKELASRDVCVSVKSACSEGGAPSASIMKLYDDRRRALSSFRISLSHLTTYEEIDEFLRILEDLIRRFD